MAQRPDTLDTALLMLGVLVGLTYHLIYRRRAPD